VVSLCSALLHLPVSRSGEKEDRSSNRSGKEVRGAMALTRSVDPLAWIDCEVGEDFYDVLQFGYRREVVLDLCESRPISCTGGGG